MTVGLVVVSHSRALARAAVALAQEMLHGKQIRIAVAAGLDETTFGTDAAQIVDAITAADQGAGVVVLMDLGSAVLSAELALELLDDDVRDRVVLCPAPLVEGLVVAAVAAASGASSEEVAAEAASALAGKIGHLGTVPVAAAAEAAADSGELTASFVVGNQHGLHARPAARLVQEVRRRDAHARIRNRRTESEWVDAGSLSKIATLGVRSGDEVEVRVSGSQAAETLDHILSLAARNFDELTVDTAPAAEPTVRQAPIGAAPGLGIGPAHSARLGAITIPDTPAEEPTVEWRRLGKAIASVRRSVSQLRTRTARDVGEAEASIFDAHQLLLDDAALLDDVRSRIDTGQSAVSAWSVAVKDLAAQFAAVPDAYLQARADDVRAVGDQVLRAMLGTGETSTGPMGVLVAADLTPAEAAELDPSWWQRCCGVRQSTRPQRDPAAGEGNSRRRRPARPCCRFPTAPSSLSTEAAASTSSTRPRMSAGSFSPGSPRWHSDSQAQARRRARRHPRRRHDSGRRERRLSGRRPCGGGARRRSRRPGSHRVLVPRAPGRTGRRGAVRRVPQDSRVARRTANHVADLGCRWR